MRSVPLAALLFLSTALVPPALAQSSGAGLVGATTPAPEAAETPAEPAKPEVAETPAPATPAAPETAKDNPLGGLLKGLLKPPPATAEKPEAPAAEEPPKTVEETPPATEVKPEVAEEDPPAATTPEEDPPETVDDDGDRRNRSFASISPRRLERLLKDSVDEVSVDSSGGDTTLDGTVDGTEFQVYFYECDGGDMSSVAKPNSKCLGYEFRAYFPDYPTDVERVNQWNADHHYGKLWVDSDGDLAVQLNVIVEGGIREDNVMTTLAWFKAVLEGVHETYR
jgi:hypothetical protein